MSAGLSVGTGTLSTRDVDAEPRIPEIAGKTDFAVEAVGPVTAVDALAGLGVAHIGVAVTLARATVRKAPEARLTLVAPAAVGILGTVALAIGLATERVEGPQIVTVAG